MHEQIHHLRQHHWSCATLANPKDAIIRGPDDTPCCGYCGARFQGGCSDEDIVAHLINDHKSGDCDKGKKFKRAAHFMAHLKTSHGAVYGTWTRGLVNACEIEKTPPSDGVVASSVDATQTETALTSAVSTTCTPLPIPHTQDDVPPPLPPPIYIPEISTTPNSDGQSFDHYGAADRRDSAAVHPGSRLPDEGLDSLHSIGVAGDDGVTRKRRMSSSVSESAKDGYWTGSTTQAGIEAATVESTAEEVCTKPPASPPGPISAIEEGNPKALHVCSACQRRFARRTILKNHERTHTGERPYSCTFEGCIRTFAQQGDKTRHETTQHTEKTFICGSSQDEGLSWGCGKKFRRKDGLLEHHSKTKKGKQCVADRDKLMALGRIGDGESPAFP